MKDFERLREDKKIKNEVISLIAFKVVPKSMIDFNGYGIQDVESMTYLHEHQIVECYEIYKSSIVRLKREYPELYEIREDFFNKVTNSVERKKLQTEHRKNAVKYRSEFNRCFDMDEDDYEEDDFDG